MKQSKVHLRTHFEFRVREVNDDYDMVVCNPDGTFFKGKRGETLITDKNPLVVAERLNVDEKTGLKAVIIPLSREEARLYVEHFNNVRANKGWEPLTFSVLTENV